MRHELFENDPIGENVNKYVLSNNSGMEVELTNYGACITAIRVPDRRGKKIDVVLGYDSLLNYRSNAPGFGAYVGRNCNRIRDAWVEIDGVTYLLDVNNNGHNLHSGYNRSHYKVYDASEGRNRGGKFVELRRVSPHLEQGFPGNLHQMIRYTLSDDNKLIIDYEMVSDKDTVINPTNHSYFNLNGHNSGSICTQILEIFTDKYTPTNAELIPTGEIASVIGTPLDFTKAKAIGKDILSDFEQIKIASGYDHNYVFPADGILRLVAKLSSTSSGIVMDVYTDCCGLHLYTGNFLNGERGKENTVYERNAGVCFETQHFPNACKTPNFPTSIVAANQVFRARSIYQFAVRE